MDHREKRRKGTKHQRHNENKTQASRETPQNNNGEELPETAAGLKWPLTRRGRIQELDIMYEEFEGIPQVQNIQAAKVWHSQFPLGEYVQDEMVFFQKGKKIEKSELRAGLIWNEVSERFILY